jgi:hypothetical protein
MTRSLRIALVLIAAAILAQQAGAQESKAAKYTREKLKQVIGEIDEKEVGAKTFFEDVNRELEKELKFKIDGTTGISNNTKLSYKGKKVTVEKLLNDVSDKYEFGWIVISNPGNNKEDGNIVIRRSTKGKERGYEAGKEPKEEKKSSLEAERDFKVAEFYRRTGHPGSTVFYYELVGRRYPGTTYADLAEQRKLELK